MGTLSYGVYAWHGYLMASIDRLATDWVTLLLACAAGAYVSYRWVELPALKLKRWQGVGTHTENPVGPPDMLAPSRETSAAPGRGKW
jgi:peptidoglycan/LPS O-acetylase OafA/YrhL